MYFFGKVESRMQRFEEPQFGHPCYVWLKNISLRKPT